MNQSSLLVLGMLLVLSCGNDMFEETVANLGFSKNQSKWVLPMWLEEVPIMWQGDVFTYKSLYVGGVDVGSPPKKFTLIFDTGSGNTVIPQTSCTSLGCKHKQLYDRKMSRTSTGHVAKLAAAFPTGVIFIKYGDGDISGTFVRDQVCVEDGDEKCIFLDMVQAHRMTSNPFALFTFDGVLGLGLRALSVDTSFSFLQQVMAARPDMLRQFSIFLSRDQCENSIILGGYDERHTQETPKWVKVSQPELGYWQVDVESFRIGGDVVDGFCDDGGCRAVTDLGSTLLIVPTDIYKWVEDRLMGFVPEELNHDALDCRNFVDASMTVEFDLGEFSLTMHPRDYMIPTPFNVSGKNGTVHRICSARIHHMSFPPPLGPKVFILGHPIHRTYYTMYNWEDLLVGFAFATETPSVRNCSLKHLSPPAYIRDFGDTDYYLPHLTGPDEEMEEKIRNYADKPGPGDEHLDAM